MNPWAIAINKPISMTSYDVIRHFKRNLPKPLLKKIGHLGTLDPFADGVLIVTACGGCRVMDYCHQFLYKTYEATGLLGQKMDTGDLSGEVVARNDESELEKLEVLDWEAFFNRIKLRFYNQYMQSIPHFSATKHNGKKLYELARQGVKVEKPPVLRFIQSLKFIKYEKGSLTIESTCSSGTYIRQLFEDIASELDLYGHLTVLRRTAIGSISLEDSVELETVSEDSFKELKKVDLTKLLPLVSVHFDDSQANRLKNGMGAKGNIREQNLVNSCSYNSEVCWALNENDQLVGIVLKDNEEFRPKVNFGA